MADHEDHCQRAWDKGALDKVWVTDFTYLRCGAGWVYLCAVRDAHSRRVLGWAASDRQDTSTLIRALEVARERRGRMPADLVLHADRGCQLLTPAGCLHEGRWREGVDGPDRGVLGGCDG